MSGVLLPGESMKVHGSYSIHVYAPNATATLENTHFADAADSWMPVVLLDSVTPNTSIFIELAGEVRFTTTDPDARASLVSVNIGGSR
jgi:hypothetical protein